MMTKYRVVETQHITTTYEVEGDDGLTDEQVRDYLLEMDSGDLEDAEIGHDCHYCDIDTIERISVEVSQ
jgi:hypothetical protein